MEVKGEARGENGCFMGPMSALLNAIRHRLRPKRRRQRTKNHRICNNSAMAKKKSAKEREPAWAYSGLNAKPSKLNRVAKGTPANTELQERLKSSVRAFEEKRKPRRVVLQPAEPAGQAEVIMENTEAGEDLNPAKQLRDMASIKNTQLGGNPQHGELDLQADEPATGPDSIYPVPSDWTLEHLMENLKSSADDDEGDQAGPGSSYPVPSESALDHLVVEQSSSADETGEDLQPNEPATGPDSSSPGPFDWTVEHLMVNLKSSADKEKGDKAGPGSSSPVPSESALDHLMEEQSASADETGEDLQPNEPASWGLTHDQMYRDMTGQDREAIMYSGPFSFVVPSKWAFNHLSGVECEEQDSRPYAMVFY
ncbi:uncharacterized protein LOC134071742 [Sardina pilchardus]|uniref:uncharacterized protein LOC134071742 n=1 Tax=Sardina pilchardus TaxID=27697 RepID=UPI002E14FC6B